MKFKIASQNHKEEFKTMDVQLAKMMASNLCVKWEEVTHLIDERGRVLQTSYPSLMKK